MPKVKGNTWRRCRARMDITSNQAAQLLGIAGGSLRQIETGVKPASLALAFRAERLYGVSVDDLIYDEDAPKPPPKKAEPKIEKTAPDRRVGKTGPKRATDEAA
jgi:DNA-binding XRE family transcriptional regulator